MKVLLMSKLVPLQRRKVMKTLKNNGFDITREGGKHTVVERQDEESRWWTTFVPRHKEISIGVVQEIIKQTEKNREEFY